jgi:Uma2 family endonuclease
MSVYAPTYRFNVAEFQKLGEAGIFHEDDRVELLNGEIIVMSPIGYRHSSAVRHLIEIFSGRSRRRYFVDAQSSFVLDDGSEPQPDITLLHREADRRGRLPNAEDVYLIVEVSDTSLGYDREEKLPAYARNGIAEVWIVNLTEDVIEVYRNPSADGYGPKLVVRRGESVAPLAFGDVEVPAAEVLPEVL